MSFEQINQPTEKEEIDVFTRGPVIVGESLAEKHLEDYQDFIEENRDLIHQFDTARNQKEASMFYKELIKTNEPAVVREVYDFVKTQKQER